MEITKLRNYQIEQENECYVIYCNSEKIASFIKLNEALDYLNKRIKGEIRDSIIKGGTAGLLLRIQA